jgi:TonB family protein
MLVGSLKSTIRHLALPSFVFVSLLTARGQPPLSIDSAQAQGNLIKHVDPVYPPIAKAAQVQGDVVLQIDISPDGHVAQVKPLSGPPMLIPSATSAVQEWQYKPFLLNGVAVLARTTVTIPFSLGITKDPNEEKTAQQFFPLSERCHQLVSRRADPGAAVDACQKSAETADHFPKNSRYIERRSAYVYYATALIQDKRANDAVPITEKAIAVVREGHDDRSGASAAYGVAGQAKAISGDLVGADKDLETAEDYQRKALDSPAGHDLQRMYSYTLKSLLSFHAQVLTALGKQGDAQRKIDEASKL